jgi:extradiol dioxygenase family protein
MSPTKPFHLSIGVRSLKESLDFFVGTLKSVVLHRDPSGYVNIDMFGSQITLKENPNIDPQLPDFHFGVNLSLEEFNALSEYIFDKNPAAVWAKPKVIDSGTPQERKKMYLKCPTGYLVELKGYK